MKSEIILFIVLFLIFPMHLMSASKKVLLAYDVKANPPFYLGSGTQTDWKKPGITLELLKSMETKLNIDMYFRRIPWNRSLYLLGLNEIDGVFHASFKPERMKIGVYPMRNGKPDPDKRVMSNSYVIYKRKDSPLQWDGKKFSHLNGYIGATLGFSIVDDLKQMGVNVSEGKNQLDNLRRLITGRLDGVAALETMTDLYILGNPEKFKAIVKLSPPLRTKPYYLILSHRFVKTNPKLASDIWNEFERMRVSGEFRNIAAKYIQ